MHNSYLYTHRKKRENPKSKTVKKDIYLRLRYCSLDMPKREAMDKLTHD